MLECFCELYPDAPIYTLVYNKKMMHGVLENKDIRTSFIQKFPFASSKHRIFPQVMPIAIEQFNFSKYDIVLSDSSSFAKGVITGPETLHICYMHTPMRYAWDDCHKYTQDFYFPGFIKKLVPLAMNYLRLWDRISAERVDRFIANSRFVAKRIKKYYKKESEIIHPPVNFDDFFVNEKTGNYFLMVGRLIAYKRFDIAIKAFNRLKLPLKIIGRGPELKRLQKIAGPTIEFLGRVPDEDLAKYYSQCRAFIFPQEEDFGIVAIEALASGRPLIAFRGGDIPEHIEENKDGIFFDNQTAEDIVAAVGRFEKIEFDSVSIREKARKFDKSAFKNKIKDYVEKEYIKHKN